MCYCLVVVVRGLLSKGWLSNGDGGCYEGWLDGIFVCIED